jgi:hypothetical protein
MRKGSIMVVRRIMTRRFCLAFGVALTVASVLVTQRPDPASGLEGQGVVFVYFASHCSVAGDSRDCREIVTPSRPAFESMAACSAHADVELQSAHDPKLMASCMKLREA